MAALPTHSPIERPLPIPRDVFLPLEFEGADEPRRARELIEREKAQCVPHYDADSRSRATFVGTVPPTAEHHRERGKAEVRLRLTATSGKEEQIDCLAILAFGFARPGRLSRMNAS